MLSPHHSRTRTRQITIRVMACLTAVMMGAGLYILGAQPIAAGLFTSPWDKLAHACTFAVIGGATGLASGARGWRRVAWCVAGAFAIGMMDELHQVYLPGRTASWSDLGADAFGGLLGAALLRIGDSLQQWRARTH